MTHKERSRENARLIFQSPDLGCSAALVCKGFDLVSLDRTNPRKVNFEFQEQAEIQETADLFWRDKLLVNPRIYFDALKLLKSRIYSD